MKATTFAVLLAIVGLLAAVIGRDSISSLSLRRKPLATRRALLRGGESNRQAKKHPKNYPGG